MVDFDIVKSMEHYYKYLKYRTTKISGTPPITFKSKGKHLKNYRIYGNTVNGESVGDRTENLVDSEHFENGTIYTGPQYTDRNYSASKANDQNFLSTRLRFKDLMSINGTCTISIADGYKFAVVVFQNGRNSGQTIQWHTEPLTITNLTFSVIVAELNYSTIHPEDISTFMSMINIGTTPLPYEPYGYYKVPVTVSDGINTETTNIYLNDQLGKSGNTADYIDYKTQKRYNADNTSEDISLPEINTTLGTNTLTITTCIQPSELIIRGNIRTH